MKTTNETRGLRIGGAVTMGVGLYMMLGGLVPGPFGLDVLYGAVLRASPDGASLDLFARASAGIIGAVTLGFGDLVRRLAAVLETPSRPGVRSAIRGAVLSWFIVDSVFSIAIGGPLNLVGNVVLMALLAGPTWLPPSRSSATEAGA